MARDRTLIVCALNLSANPHPDGVYISLLRQSARYIVRARANDYSKITTPRKYEADDLYTGRILVWTEIDLKKPWLDLNSEETLSPALKKSIAIPPSAKPNFRVFNYVFSEKKHLLYFESVNEFGETLGPHTAKTIFTSLLSRELHGLDSPEVEVTVMPQSGVVERILAIPRLRKLYIRVTLPNPDSGSPAARRRVFARLEEAKARQLEEEYTRSAEADHLVATKEIRETAEVAAENGFVRGEGRDANGKKLEIATDRNPRRFFVSAERGGSFVSRLLASVRLL